MIAVAWASTYEKTAAAARGYLDSGATRWLLNEDESVFSAFEVNSQPVAVLVNEGVEVNRWFGRFDEAELRENFESLIS